MTDFRLIFIVSSIRSNAITNRSFELLISGKIDGQNYDHAEVVIGCNRTLIVRCAFGNTYMKIVLPTAITVLLTYLRFILHCFIHNVLIYSLSSY